MSFETPMQPERREPYGQQGAFDQGGSAPSEQSFVMPAENAPETLIVPGDALAEHPQRYREVTVDEAGNDTSFIVADRPNPTIEIEGELPPAPGEIDTTGIPIQAIIRRLYEGGTPSWTHLDALPSSDEGDINDNVILRRFPADHHRLPPMTPGEAEQRISDTLDHLKILAGTPEEPGIIIPNTFYQVVEQKGGTAIISNITERVDDPKFNVRDWYKNGMDDPDEQQAILHMVNCQIGYFQWVLDTNQPVLMADVFNISQFRRGPGNRAKLIDTDPYTVSLGTKEGWYHLSQSLIGINTTLNALPPVMREREKLRGAVKRMRAIHDDAWQNLVPTLPSARAFKLPKAYDPTAGQ